MNPDMEKALRLAQANLADRHEPTQQATLLDMALRQAAVVGRVAALLLAIYLALIGSLWWWTWSQSSDLTARLAVGDSARAILTVVHAAVSFVGATSAIWFFLLPKRKWRYGLIACAPLFFTWILIKTVGGNVDVTNSKNVYKYCTFDPDSLVIAGYYDLARAQRKSPPPYYDPNTGVELVPCAQALRQRDTKLKAREVAERERQRQAELERQRQAELERRKRLDRELRSELVSGLNRLATAYAQRAGQLVVRSVFENGQDIVTQVISQQLDEQSFRLKLRLKIEWRGWFRANRQYSTDGVLSVHLSGQGAVWQSDYVNGNLLAYMRGMHPEVALFAQYRIGHLGYVDPASKALFVMNPGEERHVWWPQGTYARWSGNCSEASSAIDISWNGDYAALKSKPYSCAVILAVFPPRN